MVIRIRGITIDNKRRAITHDGVTVSGIAPVTWRFLMCLLLGGGLTAEELFDKIYGYRADGGPLGGRQHTRIMVHHALLKRLYVGLGLKRYTTYGSGPARYEVIPEQDEHGCR